MVDEKEQFNILLIEDDNDHAEVIEFYIKEAVDNAAVSRISNGENAMEYIKNHENKNTAFPQLILLDLKVPKFDGNEVLRGLKRNPDFQPIPVVIFTTSNSNADIEKALRQGANSYIVKPIEENKFREVIKIIITYWEMNERIKEKRR